jgi:hypothetical protein
MPEHCVKLNTNCFTEIHGQSLTVTHIEQVLRLTSDRRLEVKVGSGLRCGPNVSTNTTASSAAQNLQLGPLVGLDFAADGSIILADKLTAKQFRLLKIHSTGAVDILNYSANNKTAVVDISGLAVSPGGDIFLADNTQLKIFRLSVDNRQNNATSNNRIEVVDKSAGELYQFDRQGRHLATRSLLTGQPAYTFHYSQAEQHLGWVEDLLGNQVVVVRDPANSSRVVSIQNPLGHKFPLRINKIGKILRQNFCLKYKKYMLQVPFIKYRLILTGSRSDL